MNPEILILRDDGADPNLPLPSYETEGAAGADLRADLGGGEISLAPLERRLIPTGLKMQIPQGYEVQVRARSGAALRDGLSLVNGVGTIDADYRGPVGVIAINLSDRPLTIRHGDRIAQIVVAPVSRASFSLTAHISETGRGGGGFGSTGRG
ncbi:dUTP diphosphatase [Paracoccus aerodenitrificans]|uniref:dUTP diphosphatase n=1 Tax=Paracoccus aerodenitrificans TaxID=3017781 RepID=UPI0022F0BF26|nr:dUTP diphosphatase [Paracoccus aerodenitrificans]WBU65015.1 dUTP diphosphatase [Paracoccus aerodenitrificans]